MPNPSKAIRPWRRAALLTAVSLPVHAQVFAWVQLGDDNRLLATGSLASRALTCKGKAEGE